MHASAVRLCPVSGPGRTSVPGQLIPPSCANTAPVIIRAAGLAQGVPTAMLSRGLAGLAGPTLVVNLPGSTGGVRDALGVLEPVLVHALSQVRGGDH